MVGGIKFNDKYALQTSFSHLPAFTIQGIKYKQTGMAEVRKIYIDGVDKRQALKTLLAADEIITVYNIPGLEK